MKYVVFHRDDYRGIVFASVYFGPLKALCFRKID